MGDAGHDVRRTAAIDFELGGQSITEGDKVVMFYHSGNWDTEAFDHPEQFDLSRSPNPHVGFGGGRIAFLPRRPRGARATAGDLR